MANPGKSKSCHEGLLLIVVWKCDSLAVIPFKTGYALLRRRSCQELDVASRNRAVVKRTPTTRHCPTDSPPHHSAGFPNEDPPVNAGDPERSSDAAPTPELLRSPAQDRLHFCMGLQIEEFPDQITELTRGFWNLLFSWGLYRNLDDCYAMPVGKGMRPSIGLFVMFPPQSGYFGVDTQGDDFRAASEITAPLPAVFLRISGMHVAN
ncbi:hypothetical protein B0H14DRAFT_2593151 [Mycena olivaceomarginata]|nr:hypothetical protein B0H14DRAFT_2593151 [Mycena olivaceomarginata]